MKVFVQVIDMIKGISQYGMIEEPVVKGKEIDNALAHFGVSYGSVNWLYKDKVKYGEIEGTSKIVTVVTIQVVSDQPSQLMQV